MKLFTICLHLSLAILLFPSNLQAQKAATSQNIIIVTTDGFRWQELFTGADPQILANSNYVKDTALLQQLYGDTCSQQRRQKLMPFVWNIIAKHGQLYGNRLLNNKMNVSNIYKISYPGYNELLTGYPDPRPIPNTPSFNRNVTILEYLNKQEEYKGKVAAFCSWNLFPYIFNSKRCDFPVNSGYQLLNEEGDSTNILINGVQQTIANKGHTRFDQLTFLSAKEYLQQHHPRVLMLALGETDEFAHQGKYDLYLNQANQVDKILSDLWYYLQTDPFYKNNTTLVFTTDHGRGNTANTWKNHHLFIKGSGETWLAMIGAGIASQGEMKNTAQGYQKQIASTITTLLGQSFESNHTAAPALHLPETKAVILNPPATEKSIAILK